MGKQRLILPAENIESEHTNTKKRKTNRIRKKTENSLRRKIRNLTSCWLTPVQSEPHMKNINRRHKQRNAQDK